MSKYKVLPNTFETSTTQGVGAKVLLGAATGARAFSAGLADGALVAAVWRSAVEDGQWEEGVYQFAAAANTLTPVLVTSSSNGGAAVNWGPGTRNVWSAVLYPRVMMTGTAGELQDGNGADLLVPVANGGTGASTAAAARTSLGALATTGGTISGSLTVTGAISGPAGSAVYSDGSVGVMASGGSPGLYIKGGLDRFGIGGTPTIIESQNGSGLTINSAAAWMALGTANIGRWFMETAGLRPMSDNTANIGHASYRLKEVFAANPVINTSDATLKRVRGDLTPAEHAAWSAVRWQVYQWLEAVADKGDGARLHGGLIAQEVADAFVGHGLDPWAYALLCRDPVMTTRMVARPRRMPVMMTVEEVRWRVEDGRAVREVVAVEVPATEDLPLVDETGAAVLGEDGQPMTVRVVKTEIRDVDEAEEVQATDPETGAPLWRLGIRYAEAQAMEAAYLRAELATVKARLAAGGL